MRQMLAGLETLHASNYLHCDIKPSNIMIDPLGYVKIIDFGRANLIHEKSSILVGTPMFMAPEIHDRAPASIQSDLYSVGLVGLFLMTGRVLCPGGGVTEQQLKEVKSCLPHELPGMLRLMSPAMKGSCKFSGASGSLIQRSVTTTLGKRSPTEKGWPSSTNNSHS